MTLQQSCGGGGVHLLGLFAPEMFVVQWPQSLLFAEGNPHHQSKLIIHPNKMMDPPLSFLHVAFFNVHRMCAHHSGWLNASMQVHHLILWCTCCFILSLKQQIGDCCPILPIVRTTSLDQDSVDLCECEYLYAEMKTPVFKNAS